ncbi:MAG: hypothetical protein KGK02_02145, partial [Rhodospirillales bacterium]|nr:hypothetical protein [Rhodospirillales bacterium]
SPAQTCCSQTVVQDIRSVSVRNFKRNTPSTLPNNKDINRTKPIPLSHHPGNPKTTQKPKSNPLAETKPRPETPPAYPFPAYAIVKDLN